MKRLKDKLKATSAKLAKMSVETLNLAVEYTVTLAVICLLGVAVLKAPEMHNKWYHASVGSRVYMIRDSYNGGGGTGFAVKAPSGQSYILTNDHVCGVSGDGRTVLVSGPEGSMRRNIIGHDDYSDLCIIEGMPGVEGITVASSEPDIGDTLTVVGHPRLMPTHVSEGEMTGTETVVVSLGPISLINPRTGQEEQIPPSEGGVPAEQCRLPKHSQITVDLDMVFFILKVKFCALTVKNAYVTSVIIHPGNSGSPVVNFWGNIIGVAFAADDTNWGRMVPLHDIKAFLKNY